MTPGARVLGALALALVGAAAAMLGGAEPVVPEAVPMIAIPPRLAAASPPADLGARWAATVLARPLFSPDRRSAPPMPPEGAAPPPRLTGTVIGSFGKRAIFAGRLGGDRSAAVGENGRIGVWTVQAISAGTVTVAGPDGVLELRVGAEGGRSAQAGVAAAPPEAAPSWANPCGRPHLRRAGADKPGTVGARRCVLAAAGLPTGRMFP